MEVFLELALYFFPKISMVLGAHVVLRLTKSDFLKKMFAPAMGKIDQG